MDKLITLTREYLLSKMTLRNGENKMGEIIGLIDNPSQFEKELLQCQAEFVIIGLPEDVGVRANYGRAGTSSAWDNFLSNFINIQINSYCQGQDLILAGSLDFSAEMLEAEGLNVNDEEERSRMNELVSQIDETVSYFISTIVKSGKIPIIIGGGHNNAYGNIKGLSIGKNMPVNIINFDAHTDLRPLEGRHSGNGFSYAYNENWLMNYFIFGLHENYLSQSMEELIDKSKGRIRYNTYEQITIRKEKDYENELREAKVLIADRPFGIELDLDSMPFMPSSAVTSTGFSPEIVRHGVNYFGKLKNASYIHICEGAPNISPQVNPNLVGKFIAHVVTDFVKSKT